MDKKKIIISNNIRKKRREFDWTQKELGIKIGVPYQQIQKWEGGQEPNWKYKEKLASVLGVTIEQLTADNSESTASSPVQDVVAEDTRLKLIIQYLEKIIRLLEPPTTEDKEKLISQERSTPSPERKMGQD